MLHTRHLGVLAAQNKAEFLTAIAHFAQNLGFRTVDALTVVDHGDARTDFICVDNIGNPDWNAIDPNYWKRDPVMQHCKRSSVPIAWGSENYRSPLTQDIYELVSAYGLKSGISVTSHLRNGRHFAFCVHTDECEKLSSSALQHAIPELQLFATYALDTAFRLFLPADSLALDSLGLVEADALNWVLDGKSTEEISQLLNLSDSEVRTFLKEIADSFDCVNEHQAALKALRLGIIY